MGCLELFSAFRGCSLKQSCCIAKCSTLVSDNKATECKESAPRVSFSTTCNVKKCNTDKVYPWYIHMLTWHCNLTQRLGGRFFYTSMHLVPRPLQLERKQKIEANKPRLHMWSFSHDIGSLKQQGAEESVFEEMELVTMEDKKGH